MFVYTVTAELPTEALARAFLAWLEDDHLADVVRAGAERGEAVLLDQDDDAPRFRVECRYHFASREAFRAYEAGPAEALRADGRARFGDLGVRFARHTGELKVVRA